jgi:hypothetical protein
MGIKLGCADSSSPATHGTTGGSHRKDSVMQNGFGNGWRTTLFRPQGLDSESLLDFSPAVS